MTIHALSIISAHAIDKPKQFSEALSQMKINNVTILIFSFVSQPDFLSFAYSFLCEVLGATILKGVMTFRYLCPRANCVSPWCHEKLRREGGSERRQCHFLTRSTTTPTPLRQYKRREQATCLPPYTIPTQQYS